jgi:hypothetical protein
MTGTLPPAHAIERVTEILRAITASEEWGHLANTVASMSWGDSRERFRRFFDVYEGGEGEEAALSWE